MDVSSNICSFSSAVGFAYLALLALFLFFFVEKNCHWVSRFLLYEQWSMGMICFTSLFSVLERKRFWFAFIPLFSTCNTSMLLQFLNLPISARSVCSMSFRWSRSLMSDSALLSTHASNFPSSSFFLIALCWYFVSLLVFFCFWQTLLTGWTCLHIVPIIKLSGHVNVSWHLM